MADNTTRSNNTSNDNNNIIMMIGECVHVVIGTHCRPALVVGLGALDDATAKADEARTQLTWAKVAHQQAEAAHRQAREAAAVPVTVATTDEAQHAITMLTARGGGDGGTSRR